MGRDPQFVRLFPAWNFEEKPRQMMQLSVLGRDRFTRPKSGAMFG
jgi:hypothetical protein